MSAGWGRNKLVVWLASHESKDDKWKIVAELVDFSTKFQEEGEARKILSSILNRKFSFDHNRTELWTRIEGSEISRLDHRFGTNCIITS